MKTLSLMILLATQAVALGAMAQGTSIDKLQFECSGTGVVVGTSEPHYSPYKPPHFRAPEIPASASYKAKIKVSQLDAGCEVLQTKYLVNLQSEPVETVVSVWPPLDLATTALVAKSAIGHKVTFHTVQSFSYVTEGKYLPFFPDVHGEQIQLQGQLAGSSGHQSFIYEVPVYLGHVYGIYPPEGKSDKQKLELAGQLMWQLTKLGKSVDLGDFGNLFFKLEPASKLWKKDYANLIWLLFENIKQEHSFTQFFDFSVGGQGAYVGKPFADKISELSGEFSHEEKVELLSSIPTLLAKGLFEENCFQASSSQIEEVVSQAKAALPHMTLSQKSLWKEVIMDLAQPKEYGCLKGQVTAAAQADAIEIAKQLQ